MNDFDDILEQTHIRNERMKEFKTLLLSDLKRMYNVVEQGESFVIKTKNKSYTYYPMAARICSKQHCKYIWKDIDNLQLYKIFIK